MGKAAKTKAEDAPRLLAMACAHHRAGRTADADVLYRQLPNVPDALHLRGVLAQQNSNPGEALRLILRALEADGTKAIYYQSLGVAYYDLEKYEQAAGCYEHADWLEPHNEVTLRNLGNARLRMGDYEAALVAYERALAVEPQAPYALLGIASTLCDCGEYEQSTRYAMQLLEKNPDMAEAYFCLALALHRQSIVTEARPFIEKGLELKPNDSKGWLMLTENMELSKNLAGMRQCALKGLELDPGAHRLFSVYLASSQYWPGYTPELIFQEHLEFSRCYEAPLAAEMKAHANAPEPERKLRIGYVSPEFRRHAMQHFIEPVIKMHDRARFEIHCYYNFNSGDEVTDRFKAMADRWIPCANMTDAQLAERIRQDGIDILIDLSGHCSHHRLLTFARKPAPVQITWMAYPCTTGLKTMDYRITDAWMDPAGESERYHTETLLRLPYSAAYQAPAGAPEVEPLPALSTGIFTFACLNNPMKINLPLVTLWARILAAVPNSRLVLGNMEFPETRNAVLSWFAQNGIDQSRLLLLQTMSMPDYLAAHHHVDLALDTFPYCGGTTTNHSLWMGVPVLTLSGDTSVSRIGGVLVSRVGLPEFVVDTPEEYVARAIAIATDLLALERIRKDLRARMMQQTALDPHVFIAQVESAFRDAWRRWCDQRRSIAQGAG